MHKLILTKSIRFVYKNRRKIEWIVVKGIHSLRDNGLVPPKLEAETAAAAHGPMTHLVSCGGPKSRNLILCCSFL